MPRVVYQTNQIYQILSKQNNITKNYIITKYMAIMRQTWFKIFLINTDVVISCCVGF